MRRLAERPGLWVAWKPGEGGRLLIEAHGVRKAWPFSARAAAGVARKPLGLNGRHPLFCTLQGTPMKAPYLRVLLPRLAAKAGIEKRVHPHGFRHAHAAELMREGIPLNVIQQQLGHSSVATTSRYLAHIAPQEVIDAMKQREWEL